MTACRPLGAALALTLILSTQAPASPEPLGSRAVVVSAWDHLVTDGAAVTLSAKLERAGFGSPGVREEDLAVDTQRFWRRDLEGRTLRFVHQGTVLGEDVTDDDGDATVEWTPPGLGDHLVDVVFEGDDRYAPGRDQLLVSVRDHDRDLVVLDIDHTLSETSNWNVIRGRVDDEALPHSPEVVAKLAAAYDLVYVTARPNKFLDVTKRWLVHRGFPRNPVFLLDLKSYPSFDEAQYKTDTLGAIKESFPNLVMGIGDKETDAEAYRNHGLRTLILGEVGDVAGAEPVADWLEIDSILFGEAVRRFARLHLLAH